MKKKYFFIGAAVLFSALLLAGLLRYRQPLDKPNVLFITIDTLRSDHLGCYGYNKIKTPNIDALASHGTMFKNVVAQVPLTFPSHVSLFTSTYPQFNKALDNGNYRLDDSAVTLAEIVQKDGYTTAAFVSSFVLKSKFGLNKGFATYDDSLQKIRKKRTIKFMDEERTADQVTKEALEWLRLHKNKKFFLWVHYYDPHAVYNPPSPYKEAYKDDLYDGEIAFVDHFIGVLLQGFKDCKLDKNTLIIVTSDHGEGLGEHDETGHGIFLYDTTLKVPLIFSWEGKVAAGRRVANQVRLVDVMPTVLDLLHIRKNKEIQGISLLSLVKGGFSKIKDLPAYSVSSFAKAHFNWEELESWREKDWKYIKSSEPQLYDVLKDPNELRNLFSKRERLAEEFDERMAQFVEKTGSSTPEKKIEVDKETRARLMSLGYIQGGGTSDSKGPIPMKMIKTMEKLNLADRLANEGLMVQAIKIFHEVITEDPNNIDANLHLAQCYKETGRYDEAIKYFKKAASFKPDEVEVHNGLGNIYKSMGRREEAFKEFSIARGLDPKDPVIINNIGWYYQQKMEIGKAMEQYKEALSLDNKLATTHVNIAILLRVQKRLDEAMDELNTAIKLEPELAFAYSELCACVATKGDLQKAIPYCQKSIDLDADNIDGYNNLGVCYERLGELHKALENYGKALRLAPWNTLFYCNIANVYLALHEPQESKMYLERALKIDPNARKALRMLKSMTSSK